MAASFTVRQGQFLSFIYDYTKLNGQPPAERDMERHFQITPPSVHQMVLMLEKRGLISRTPGKPRSIRLLLPREQLPKDEPTHPPSPANSGSMLGLWRITHMDQWPQDFVDAEVDGYIRFDHGGVGEFQFGYVHGWIDHELTDREGKPAAEWSWEGNSEMDPACGRGWAVLEDDGTIKGKLSIHGGDKSGFLARSKGKPKQAVRKMFTMISMNSPKRPRE